MPFVVDASVALAACFADERSAYVVSVASALASGERALAPAIWPLEVHNGLLTAERRKRISKEEVDQLIGFLSAFPIEVDTPETLGAYGLELRLARQFQLTAYDGAYLALAQRRGFPLATIDARLNKAAASAGVQLFKP